MLIGNFLVIVESGTFCVFEVLIFLSYLGIFEHVELVGSGNAVLSVLECSCFLPSSSPSFVAVRRLSMF